MDNFITPGHLNPPSKSRQNLLTIQKRLAQHSTASSPQKKPVKTIGPVEFARDRLGLNLYKWQEKILADVETGDLTVALAAANGSGKTSMIAAPLVLWHCDTFPGCEVVTTAGVYRQVKEQLWQTIRRYHSKLGPDWKINDTDLYAPNGSRAIGFSTDDPYKFEGWHGGPSGHLLMIFDEAKAIPDSIFQAARRCNAKGKKRFLLMSSTGGVAGEFGAALTRKKHLYKTHVITAYDCPHLDHGEINDLIAEYGREHPLVRSTIFSELMDDAAHEYVITRRALQDCRDHPPGQIPGERWAFIDWAAGGDECVIAIIEGNRVLPLICWRDADTSRSVGRVSLELRNASVAFDHVFADGGGLGLPMNRQLVELGYNVAAINNGARAHNQHYSNRGAELWHRAALAIQKNQVLFPPDDRLDAQLTNRKILITPDGRLGLESKADLRARGMPSPDRADAVVGILALTLHTATIPQPLVDFNPSDRAGDITDNALTGFDAG